MRKLGIGILLLILVANGCSFMPKEEENGHQVVKIKAGTYQIGHPDIENNQPRTVEIRDFSISTTETTNAQFQKFVEATGYVTDAEKKGFAKVFDPELPEWEWKLQRGAYWRYPYGPDAEGIENRMDHPVTQISGADAKAYCEWVGGRLPTIDEWEVAARAGVETAYPWGEELTLGSKHQANTWQGEGHKENKEEDGFYYTSPVKSYPPNNWGLYDVIGNVFEYCQDEIVKDFDGKIIIYSTGRGGSWWCSPHSCDFMNLLRVGQMNNNESICNQGFRVVFDE